MAKKADTNNVVPIKKMGRPPFQWTPEIEDYILAGVIAGQSLRQIEQNGRTEHGEAKFPCAATIKNYLASNHEFLARYAKAKDIAQDLMAEDLVAIVDGTAEGFADADLDQRKASAEIRKWVMGKLRRKKWGDIKTTEVTGADGTPLIQPQIIDTRSMTPEAQMALYEALQIVAAQNDAEDVEYTEENND
jgi:hypothetical protein